MAKRIANPNIIVDSNMSISHVRATPVLPVRQIRTPNHRLVRKGFHLSLGYNSDHAAYDLVLANDVAQIGLAFLGRCRWAVRRPPDQRTASASISWRRYSYIASDSNYSASFSSPTL